METSPLLQSKMQNEIEIFQRDSNGLRAVNTEEAFIINAEESYDKALESITNNWQTRLYYYTCQHCNLYFNHPKRFLIHSKWHKMWLEQCRQAMTKKERKEARKSVSEVDNSVLGTSDEAKSPEKPIKPKIDNKCVYCDFRIVNPEQYVNHFEFVHKVDNCYQCPHCQLMFEDRQEWIDHWHVHGVKLTSCPKCQKSVPNPKKLVRHIRNHIQTQQRVADKSCTYCGKSFYDNHTLNIHERGHRNEKLALCAICNKSYASNGVLNKHIRRVHSLDKPVRKSKKPLAPRKPKLKQY